MHNGVLVNVIFYISLHFATGPVSTSTPAVQKQFLRDGK